MINVLMNLGKSKRLWYMEKFAFIVVLDTYCYIWVMLTGKRQCVTYKDETYAFSFT